MQYTHDVLALKSLDELRAIAVSNGLDWHHKHKPETLIERIIVKQSTAQPSDVKAFTPETTAKKPEDEIPTLAQIEKAIEHLVAKGLKAEFYPDNTFQFSYRGRMDSGNLAQPLNRIVKLATDVSRGGFAPPIVNLDGEKMLGA
jgi:hypothetical protein